MNLSLKVLFALLVFQPILSHGRVYEGVNLAPNISFKGCHNSPPCDSQVEKARKDISKTINRTAKAAGVSKKLGQFLTSAEKQGYKVKSLDLSTTADMRISEDYYADIVASDAILTINFEDRTVEVPLLKSLDSRALGGYVLYEQNSKWLRQLRAQLEKSDSLRNINLAYEIRKTFAPNNDDYLNGKKTNGDESLPIVKAEVKYDGLQTQCEYVVSNMQYRRKFSISDKVTVKGYAAENCAKWAFESIELKSISARASIDEQLRQEEEDGPLKVRYRTKK